MEKKRIQYGVELKLKCVMERESGKTFTQIARENNVPRATVIGWRQQASKPQSLSLHRLAGRGKPSPKGAGGLPAYPCKPIACKASWESR